MNNPEAQMPSFEMPHKEDVAIDEVSETLFREVMSGRNPLSKITDPVVRNKMERTQAAYETVAVSIHDLHLLEAEEQINVLDQVVDEIFDNDTDAQQAILEIQIARAANNEDKIKKLTAEQKDRYTKIKRETAELLGIEIEDTEKQNEQYREALLNKVAELEDASEEDIMRTLGFLVKSDSDEKEHFNFPEDIFPPHIVHKWKTYESTILAHVSASARFNRALEDNSDEIIQLDAMRRYSHNNLAKSVQEFLKLDDWDFERVRKFITKLVESRFPTVETKESSVTSSDIVGRLRTINYLHKAVHKDTED